MKKRSCFPVGAGNQNGLELLKYLVLLAVLGLVVVCALLVAGRHLSRQRTPASLQTAADFGRDVSQKLNAYAEKTYGPLGTTAGEILAHESDATNSPVLAALLWRIEQKCERLGWTNLTDTERRLVAVSTLEGEVLNGGFDQYFFNPSGGDAEVALAGLKEVGATNAAELLERAMGQFAGGKPPTGYSQRHQAMDQIQTQAKPVWDKCDSDYYARKEDAMALSLAYAKRKRSDILLP